MNIYDDPRSIEEIMAEQNRRDWFIYSGEVSVPANGSAILNIGMDADADFRACYITGNYTTISAGVDVGTCGIAMKLVDQGNNTILFHDPINLALFLSPGRDRTSGIAGDPAHSLFYPIELDHVFRATANIQCELTSNQATANMVRLAFMGYKYFKNVGQF